MKLFLVLDGMINFRFNQTKCGLVCMPVSIHSVAVRKSFFNRLCILSEQQSKRDYFKELLASLHTKVVEERMKVPDSFYLRVSFRSFQQSVVFVDESNLTANHFFWIHKAAKVKLNLVDGTAIVKGELVSYKFIQNSADIRELFGLAHVLHLQDIGKVLSAVS